MASEQIIGKSTTGRTGYLITVLSLGAALAFGKDILDGGAWGIALGVAAGLALLGVAYRLVRGRPAFVVTDDGLRFPGVCGVITWFEIEAITFAGWALESWRLQVVLRDPRALSSRTTTLYRPIARVYRAVGVLPWLTAMYYEWSPLPLDQLADEIERRAGRPLLLDRARARLATHREGSSWRWA